jgi:DNA-binding NarL/FixJ family response regulator
LQYGINGYLTKNCELSELIKAVKLAEANEVYFSRHMINGCAKKYIALHRKRVYDMLPNFTLEEIKIVELLKNEYTMDEIASSMGLSRRSIEIKFDKLRERTNVKSKIGIALYFMKRGLIEQY